MAVIYLRYTPIWAISTAYKTGRKVYNDTNHIYICTVAGTSAGSGGPTGTGTGIIDGTCTWGYFGIWTANGADANDGSTWALAKATLSAAITASSSGTVYVSQSHSEVSATALSLNSTASVICGNDAAQPPTAPESTGAVHTTGSVAITLGGGGGYWYGMQFYTGTGPINMGYGSGTHNKMMFEMCKFAPGGALYVGLNSNSVMSYYRWVNCSCAFGGASAIFFDSGDFEWRNDANIQAVTLMTPGTFFARDITPIGQARFIGLDLSLLGSGKYLVAPGGTYFNPIIFSNCKLGASVTVLSSTIDYIGGCTVDIDNCDSSNTNYRMEKYRNFVSIKTETVKVRTGGASNGTTTISWNMTTLSSTVFAFPVESPVFSIWNSTTGSSKTVTVEILNDGTTLTNADIWLEVEECETSGYPISTVTRNRKASVLAGTSSHPTSSKTWTTTGLASPVKQYLSVTFTPQVIGYFKCKVLMAKASKTVYIDPLITVS